MTEGQALKTFIENQRVSKQKIADDLGMTRSNLYQLFDSKTLSDETKKKFEKLFKIKWKDLDTVQLHNGAASRENVTDQNGDKEADKLTIQSLVKSMELYEQSRLLDSQSRKIEAENRRAEIANTKELIALLKIQMGVSDKMDLADGGLPNTIPIEKVNLEG